MNETLDRDGTCERIREMCEERGFTVEYLAEKMCVSRQAVYSWFSLKKIPTIDHIIELSALLGTTTDELLVRKMFYMGNPEDLGKTD